MKNRKNLLLSAVLGAAHGVVDCASGILVGFVAVSVPVSEAGLYLLLYNFLAFATQPVAGIICDKMKSGTAPVLASVLLFMAAVVSYQHLPVLAVVTAGVASSLFHAAAGGLVLQGSGDTTSAAGLFAAPGVAGLAIAGILVASGTFPVYLLLLLLLLCGAGIAAAGRFVPPFPASEHEDEPVSGHLLVMALLLAAIAFRSVIWNIAGYLHTGDANALLVLGISAAFGKVAGGFGADWFGIRRWLFISLPLAAGVLASAGQSLGVTAAGVFLLQSATPAAAIVVASRMKTTPALASGLIFGLAIAAGGIPFISTDPRAFSSLHSTAPLLIVIVLLATWRGIRQTRTAPA